MDEPIRFADILFTLLTLLITGLILYAVNRGRKKENNPPETSSDQEKESQTTK